MALNVSSLSLPVASTSSKSIASASKPSASTSKPSASTSIATAASVESFYDSMLEAAEEEQDECTDEVVSVSSSDHDHTVQYLSTGDMAMVRISNGKKLLPRWNLVILVFALLHSTLGLSTKQNCQIRLFWNSKVLAMYKKTINEF